MFTSQTFPPLSNPQLQQSLSPINPEIRTKSCLLLNQILANLLDLQSQYRVAHWNVVGMDFYYTHKFFEDLYNMCDELIDKTAELIRYLGCMATGTVRDVSRDSKINEFDISKHEARSYIAQLNINLAIILESILKSANELLNIDPVTNNYLLGLVDSIMRQTYLVESHLR